MAAAFLGLVIVEYVGLRNGGTTPITSAVKGMLDAPEQAPESPPIGAAQNGAVKKPDAAANNHKTSPSRPASGTPTLPRAVTDPAPIPIPAPTVPPLVVVPKPQPPASQAAPVFAMQQRRSDTFVPGNLRGWVGYGVTFDKPMLVRAGGEVRAGDQISGPNGLRDAGGVARSGGRVMTDTRVRVLPAAPYLALIGRVCSTEECSAPFLIGAHAVLCPSSLGITGDLQLWTNNFVQVDGYQTLESYTTAVGGYRFQAEPAGAGACDGGGVAAAVPRDAGTPLPDEQPLKDPGFTISSRQNSWKPFFIPMDRAFVIRASGQMQPLERVRATGPNGMVVPDAERWTYPGTKTVVIDADHVLLEKSLPYQALIGRLCGPKECGPAFLVGTERTICPSARYNERLELWINHIVPRSSDRGHLPFANLTFQSRRGEYRFEIASAPPCGG
ncbi:MAG: hypothetical protein ACM4AI_04575 [Acidobacteriota bacterium]